MIGQPQVSLQTLTSFRVGGNADFLAMPRSVEELSQILIQWKSTGLSLTLLGAGSNLLISDQGLPGLVICTRHLQGVTFDQTTGQVYAAAGEPIPRLAWKAAARGWSGLEWAVGIPGTVGGMAVMNAGAQGGCAADLINRVEICSPSQPTVAVPVQDLAYGYRSSSLQGSDQIVTGVVFNLQPGFDPAVIKEKTRQNWHHRHTTQPYHLPSCGSVFRNPLMRSAGWLIEQSGLKGFQIGNAQVSELHANFILNLGGAQAIDIYRLIQSVQERVAQQWSILLEPEVKMLGSFH